MSALEEARDHHLSLFGDFERTLGNEPAWLHAMRRDALEAFREQGLPHTKLEDWRSTNVAPIARVPFELPDPRTAEVSREVVERLSFPVFACSLYVFVDGRYDEALSAPRALSGRRPVESLAAVRRAGGASLEPHFGRLASVKQNAFAALNAAFFDDGAVLRVPAGEDLVQPIHVVFLSTAGSRPRVSHPRVLVHAEPGSRVTLIQDHVTLGDPAPGFTNAVTEVLVDRDAEVHTVLLQREHDRQLHVSGLHVRQERGSRFSAHTLTLGGALVRNEASVLLADEGAEGALEGLFVGGGEQHIDNHTEIDHAVPHCTSRELYKGILGGKAHGVFRGRVVVRPDAQKTDAQQSNPNLLLARGAEIDSKPQLEIYADDVKCSHGATIGQINPDALFYLRSRGLDEARAREMLTRAFALEVLERLPVEGLGQGLDDVLRARLRHAWGAGEDA